MYEKSATGIVWDEHKRLFNLQKHSLDFADLTIEFFLSAYVERAKQDRFLAIGILNGQIVVAVVFRPLIGSVVHSFHASGKPRGKEPSK